MFLNFVFSYLSSNSVSGYLKSFKKKCFYGQLYLQSVTILILDHLCGFEKWVHTLEKKKGKQLLLLSMLYQKGIEKIN